MAITAIGQIICLNKSLVLCETTVVVPIFYSLYTSIGFINTLIFMNQLNDFKAWVLWCIALSTILLLGGVILLSSKKTVENNQKEVSNNENDDIPLQYSKQYNDDIESANANEENEDNEDNEDNVVWDIGDVSSDEHEDDDNDISDIRKPLRKQKQNQSDDEN